MNICTNVGKKALACLLLGCFVVTVQAAVAGAPAPLAVAGGTWKTGVPMTALRQSAGAGVVGGKIHVIGGLENWSDQAVRYVESYDPATRQWTVKGPMLKPRWGMGTAVLDGKLYAVGGYFGGGHYASEVEAYDPATDSWQVRAPLPRYRVLPIAAAVGGKIYAFGGGGPTAGEPTYAYDPAADTWSERARMIHFRYALGGAALDGKLYAVGGYSDTEGDLSSVERYDPATDTWTLLAPMSVTRIMPIVVASGGKLYVIGGRRLLNDESTQIDSVEQYDPATNTWHTMAPMPTARSAATGAVLGDVVYAMGGVANRVFLRTVEEYRPPQAVDCDQRPAVLTALISAKSGSQDARRWTLTLSDDTACAARAAQFDALTLTQTYGLACTPVITSPAAFPLGVGDIAARGKASGTVQLNFSACASTARFSATLQFSANGGAVRGSKTLNNQFR